MKFSANLGFLFITKEGNFLDRIRGAAQAGFRAIEGPFPEDFEIETVKNVLNTSGVEFNLINMKTGGISNGQFGSASFPDQISGFQKNFDTTLKYAKELNCKKIHVMAGRVENETKENFSAYVENLKYVAEKLKNENIFAVIEPINHYSVPNYYLHDFNKAIEVIKLVNSPKIKLMADLFHMQMIQGNITNTLKNLFEYIGHIQIAQAPSRHEPNHQEELNYGYIFQYLEKLGYTDWIGCEYKPKDDIIEGLKWIKEYGYEF